jgi:hypothetical protein
MSFQRAWNTCGSLFSCWQLPNVSVSGILAGWHGNATSELNTHCDSLSSGVLSQVEHQESGSGLVKPFQTVSITCAGSGYSISSCDEWIWICQHTGKGVKCIGRFYRNGNTNYNPDLKTWVTMTVDTSKNQFSLPLNSVTTEDTAMCYCARETVREFQF